MFKWKQSTQVTKLFFFSLLMELIHYLNACRPKQIYCDRPDVYFILLYQLLLSPAPVCTCHAVGTVNSALSRSCVPWLFSACFYCKLDFKPLFIYFFFSFVSNGMIAFLGFVCLALAQWIMCWFLTQLLTSQYFVLFSTDAADSGRYNRCLSPGNPNQFDRVAVPFSICSRWV